jgi:hypothetical protein
MASYVGAIQEFNPYVQQIPTDAYVKTGMFREQMYEAGLAKVQDSVDKLAGLDIANEGGRQYLRSRVDELTKTLNKYSQADFSNPNNVTQLASLAKPLYQDENIVNDVINTGIYRKWSKDASAAYQSGKMELGQYMRETTEANQWLSSQQAGSRYTGRSNPNTATKKDLVDRIIKAKKEGIEKSEYVYDKNYSTDTPYYIKSTNKHYSEADFNNFIANNIMSSKDREMLMNENWYENMGKSSEQLQVEDIMMYQSKIDANNRQIDKLSNMPNLLSGDAKIEHEQTIADLKAYNRQLADGKIKYLQTLNLADPTSRDVFHRDLSESRFISSLDILRDEVRKEEFQKNEQWFKDKELQIEAAQAALKASTSGTKTGKTKAPEEQINEVTLYTPVDPNAPKTEVSISTLSRGYGIKNDEINNSMNNLIGKLQQNGVDMNQFISGWDQVQVGGKAGASMNVPRFKSAADKERFYNLVSGLNYAYTKEAEDGQIDNQSFRKFIASNFAGYNDTDPNSKFTLADKTVSDALNTLKGTSALLPKLEGLFSDKGVVRTLAQIDSALKDKKDMANAYREAIYKSGALTSDEMKNLRTLTDDQLLSNSYYLDTGMETMRYANQGLKPVHSILKDSDGTYSVVQTVVSDPNNVVKEDFTIYKIPESMLSTIRQNTNVNQVNVLAKGYKSFDEADKAFTSGHLDLNRVMSNDSQKKVDEYIKNTYSYVQENLNSTVQNLKEDEPAYAAVKDGLAVFLNRSKLQNTPQDLLIEGGTVDPKSLGGISKVEVLGATVSNTEDIFNPNPMYNIQFTATTGQGTKDEKSSTYNAQVSLRSFLATNPNYRTSEYAKYFAPALYGQKDAYARIHSNINPLEGSEASYGNRGDIEPVYQRINQQGRPEFATDNNTQIAWETLPIERDGRQTMVSYQVVSLGQNTVLGNTKAKDGQQYEPGSFYIKLKVPTSNGQSKTIFLKKPNGDSYQFNSASYAHYTIRDLIFNNPAVSFDEIDQRTGQPNYFTTDPNTIRGIFNSQLSYNGYSKLDPVKIKDAIGNQTTKQQANELQFGTR